MTEYEVKTPQGPVKRLDPRQPDDSGSLVHVVSKLSEKRTRLRQAAASLQRQGLEQAAWAQVSPDGRFVVAGTENPAMTAVTTATVYRLPDFSPVRAIDSKGTIRDLTWSDSSSLILLESTERMRKTPWALFAALSGHPIELQTYFLRRVTLGTQADSWLTVVADVESSEAVIEAP